MNLIIYRLYMEQEKRMMNKHNEMQNYFVAIMKIAETSSEETCQAIRRICIDASNFFESNFTEEEKGDVDKYEKN